MLHGKQTCDNCNGKLYHPPICNNCYEKEKNQVGCELETIKKDNKVFKQMLLSMYDGDKDILEKDIQHWKEHGGLELEQGKGE